LTQEVPLKSSILSNEHRLLMITYFNLNFQRELPNLISNSSTDLALTRKGLILVWEQSGLEMPVDVKSCSTFPIVLAAKC